MRTLAVVYNLSCGTGVHARTRLAQLQRCFRVRGIELRLYCTSTQRSISASVHAAITSGCEAIFAAGGDGTFNELLQVTMRIARSVPIGIIPFGSGNVLAQELGISTDVGLAVEALMYATPTRISVGLLSSQSDGETLNRYFTVTAGIGADARVICGVNPAWKRRMGIGAYYVEATRQLLFSRLPMPLFQVRFTDSHTGEARELAASQLIAERVGYFSSPLSANCEQPLLNGVFRLIIFKTQDRTKYLQYGLQLLSRRLGTRPRAIKDVEVAHATTVFCDPLRGGLQVLTEVDGELVGGLPAALTLVPAGFELMLPNRGTNFHNNV